jgi:hypothetical protein
MSRIVLVHWHAAEARELAEPLRRAGHTVVCHSEPGGKSLDKVKKKPPEVFVVSLDRLPSHGRYLGMWLRQQKSTRHIPLVFAGGDPAKTQRVREVLPDAVYTDWRTIRSAVRRAIKQPPATPAVPGTMADYSGTPLPKKLGIKAKTTLALLGAPRDFERTAFGSARDALPAGVTVRKQARGQNDVSLLFVKSHAELARRFPVIARAVAPDGRLWIVWPKQAAKTNTDLTQNKVRAFGLAAKWVDFKICAVDATWSGLCFVRRKQNK